MKTYLLLLICTGFLISSCHSSNGNASGPRKFKNKAHKAFTKALTQYPEQYPVFSVADTAYDFGSIREGDIVQYDFHFKNTGTKPLIITGATSTCGCTVPRFPKEPIPPGKEGVLEVVFNSANKSGQQLKPIFVTANTMPSHFELKITCNVVAK